MSQKVSDLFDDDADFQQLLTDAESQARSEWQQDFVGDMVKRWEKYGTGMFLSDKQLQTLEDIVG